jgi:hemoglobin
MRRLLKQTIILVLIFTTVSLSFSNEAEARRRRRYRRPRKLKIINEKKLYERIGGAKAVNAMVDEWMRMNLADQRVAASFAPVTTKPDHLGRMRRGLVDQICEVSDGPCQYKGPDMKKVHGNMGVTEDQFLIVSDNLVQSMQKLGIQEREKNELLSRIAELRFDIVRDAKQ